MLLNFFLLSITNFLLIILSKAGFDSYISFFFSDYLVNSFISPFFKANVSVKQGSTLSPIFSAIHIALIFHIFNKKKLNLFYPPFQCPLFLVDDGLLISQEKNYEKLNTNLFHGYNIISSLFT